MAQEQSLTRRRYAFSVAAFLLWLCAVGAGLDSSPGCQPIGSSGSCRPTTNGQSCVNERQNNNVRCTPTSRNDPAAFYPRELEGVVSDCTVNGLGSYNPCQIITDGPPDERVLRNRKVDSISVEMVGSEGSPDSFDLTVSWVHHDAHEASPAIQGYQVLTYETGIDNDRRNMANLCLCINDAAMRNITFIRRGYAVSTWLEVRVGTFPVFDRDETPYNHEDYYASYSPSCGVGRNPNYCSSWPSTCLQLPRQTGSCNPPEYERVSEVTVCTHLLPNDTMELDVSWDMPEPILPAKLFNFTAQLPVPTTFYIRLADTSNLYFLVENSSENNIRIGPLDASSKYIVEVRSFLNCSGFNPPDPIYWKNYQHGCSHRTIMEVSAPDLCPTPTPTATSLPTSSLIFPTSSLTSTTSTPTPTELGTPPVPVTLAATIPVVVLVVLIVIAAIAIVMVIAVKRRLKSIQRSDIDPGTYYPTDPMDPHFGSSSYQPQVPDYLPLKSQVYIILSSRSEKFEEDVTNEKLLSSLNEYGIECDSDWKLHVDVATNIGRGVNKADAVLCICNQAFKDDWDNPSTLSPEVNCLKKIVNGRAQSPAQLQKFALILLCKSHRQYIPNDEYLKGMRVFNISEVEDIVHFIQRTPRFQNRQLRQEASSDDSDENDRNSVDGSGSSTATNSTVVSPDPAQANAYVGGPSTILNGHLQAPLASPP